MSKKSKLDDQQKETEEHFLKRLALVAIYEDDQKAMDELRKRGVQRYEDVLAIAQEHDDYRYDVFLAKKYARLSLDAKGDPGELSRIEKELEDKLGYKDGAAIFDLSQTVPNTFDDLVPFLSPKTIEFFKRRKEEREKSEARVAKELERLGIDKR